MKSIFKKNLPFMVSCSVLIGNFSVLGSGSARSQSVRSTYQQSRACSKRSAQYADMSLKRHYCIFGKSIFAAVDDGSNGGFIAVLDNQKTRQADIDPLTLKRRYAVASEIYSLEGNSLFRYSCRGAYGDCDLGSLRKEFVAAEVDWVKNEIRLQNLELEKERRLRAERESRMQEEMKQRLIRIKEERRQQQQYFEDNLDEFFR